VEEFFLIAEAIGVMPDSGGFRVAGAGDDAGDLFEFCGEVLFVGFHDFVLRRDAVECGEQDGGLVFSHAAFGSEHGIAPALHGAEGASEVMVAVAVIHQGVVATENGTAFAAGDVFGGLKAETAQIGKCACLFAFPFCHVALAGIFDDLEVMLSGDGVDFVHVADFAAHMDGDNGGGVFGEFFLNFIGMNHKGGGIYIDEHGEGTEEKDGVDGCDKGVGSGNDFIASSDAEAVERGDEGIGAAVCGEASGGAHHSGELFFEFIDHFSPGPDALMECFECDIFIGGSP